MLYEYECDRTGAYLVRIVEVKDYKKKQCCECGSPATRAILTPPRITPDIDPFLASTGKHISGRKAWRDHLAETNSIELSLGDIESQRQISEKIKRQRIADTNLKQDVINSFNQLEAKG